MSDMDKYINNLVCEFKRLSYEDVEDCSDTEKIALSLCLLSLFQCR